MTVFSFTEEQRDCLQELINVAMGMASDKLARFLRTLVHLQVPAIDLVRADQIPEQFRLQFPDRRAAMVSLGFFGDDGLRGETILLYQLDNSQKIAALLGYQAEEMSEPELLTDISSVLTTTFLNGLAEQLNNNFSYAAPRIVSSGEANFADKLAQTAFNWDLALKVDIRYQLTAHSFDCNMILLIPGEAVNKLQGMLDNILADF